MIDVHVCSNPSSDPFFEVCRPHTSDESKDVAWLVRAQA